MICRIYYQERKNIYLAANGNYVFDGYWQIIKTICISAKTADFSSHFAFGRSTPAIKTICGRQGGAKMIASLAMYDWPELHQANDALWAKLRDAIIARGGDAPAELSRDLGGI